jgi:uncharacterized phage protein gp47/JayE
VTYGLTSTGFVRKLQSEILTELQDAYKVAFGDDVKLDGQSVFGQLIGIQAEREGLLWEMAEAVYGAAYPDSAAGIPLDNAVALTGHARLPATYSTITATVATTGAAPVTLPIGRQARVTATGATFETIEAAVIPAGGSVSVRMRATVTGATDAPAGTLTAIVTPVAGWTSITNAAGPDILGRDVETDAELRLRRRRSLLIAQAGGIEAIQARLYDVAGVVFAGVVENRTDATDSDGRPPHSIEAIVIGGTDAAVAAQLWESKPAGIATHGSVLATVTDSFGNPQGLNFSRGAVLTIHYGVSLISTSAFPSNGPSLIQAALVAYGDTLVNGADVINWEGMASLAGIPGITSLTLRQGLAAGPTMTSNIAVAVDQVALVLSTNITVGPA